MTGKAYQSAGKLDWRLQLRRNARRTHYVMGLFILIYLCVGFVVDVVVQMDLIRPTPHGTYAYQMTPGLPVSYVVHSLLTFHMMPYATMIMGGIALISLWLVFVMHDRLMLLGTHYREITLQTAENLAEQQLYNTVDEMRVAAGLRYLPKIYLIEADYMNAFASGYSEKSAMVAITRGLLEKLERSELQAVMAHELSHVRHQDIKLTLMASVLSNILLVVVDILFYDLIYGRRKRDVRLAVVIMILRFVLPVLTMILMLYLSRTREYMADAGAVELTRDNKPLANALLKIERDYQANQSQHHLAHRQTRHEELRTASYIIDPSHLGISPVKSLATLFSTHPSLKDRLRAIGITDVEV